LSVTNEYEFSHEACPVIFKCVLKDAP